MNKVMLIGNVGKEPEVRYVDQGQPVARITLATTERGYTLQNGTRVPDRTEWHNVILWRKLAEIVERYVHKGDKLYVEGRIHYASYDDKRPDSLGSGIDSNNSQVFSVSLITLYLGFI